MKKIVIACLLVVTAATSSFGAASAAVTFTDAGKNVVADTSLAPLGRLSASDALGFLITPDSGGTFGVSYSLITQHVQGTRTYGTASDGTAIYWTPATKGTGHVVPTLGTVTEFNTGWTVM